MRFLLPLTLALPLPALAEVPQVVTDIPAVHSLAAQVMGDLGTPAVLLDQGANAHNYQMKPSQARSLQEADLVFWIGPKMTPWLDRAIAGVSLTGKPVGLLEATGTFRRDFGQTGAHDHGHDNHAQDHTLPGHGHAGLDPHAWLDPTNARYWLGLIAAELSVTDPENAATYAANAAAAAARIDALDADLTAQLAPVQARPFVVFHDAYGYFASHYGLTVAGTIALGDAAAPGAERLTGLRETLEQAGAVCLFPEAQHDPKQAALLVEGTAVKLGDPLDPSGSSLRYGPGLYEALLRGLADDLTACLTKG
ncbi:zinc ABC transporter substrate-binding protein [Rhodobacter veldkampii DSM 11550]|uniref:High-affinity zinc uptake system protein ZnuA n=1 Tax=Phaeovulum veldkampii DSM 11550 TaxID=1185920 RepID=A0A2T4JLN9_9RHOB|nr:zinc ABC transporter substrate-binding protein [Phaeovulum veldkampii]MBK5946595.1 zinc ABC transporter substrate-binding protein [Phaeovulum veldkampii DSM 11550]NCU20334.1 zinc ABC transporter substrate-binding protein [Candidatus Falkowbacteria bacterium]PTE18840.1 zinc ABC transporter substrate-binding protein [Phaeovulum veldkampii DSM 11550]TDQ59927.1 zinc transport system substrate-binding protein [Phaeovulum veldkampii DSM 11550]